MTLIGVLAGCSKEPSAAKKRARDLFVACMEERGLGVSDVTIEVGNIDYAIVSAEIPDDEIEAVALFCEAEAEKALAGEEPPKGPYDGLSKTTYQVKMRDGVSLSTDVFLPAGEGPFPAVVFRTPYDRLLEQLPEARAYLEAGVALVTQDMRGRFESEGVDQAFITDGDGELSDGHDTFAWIIEQNWCNGLLVSQGISASAIVQYMQLMSAPPGLVAARADEGTGNLYDTLFRGGVFRESLAQGWLESQGSLHFLDDIYAHPYLDDFWMPVQGREDYGRAQIPVLHVGGWYDVFVQDTLDAYVGYQTMGGDGARGRQKLIMGPWTHGGQEESLQGELAFPSHSSGPPVSALALQAGLFSDMLELGSELDFGDGAVEWNTAPVVQYYVMGDVDDPEAPGNEWREADDWPPPSSAYRLYPDSEEVLAHTCPQGEFDSYSFNPDDPSPTICGANLNIDAGPCDQRAAEDRADNLTFTTAKLAEATEITGPLSALIFVSLDQKDTDVIVKLSDVYPDGRSMLIAEGAARVAARGSLTSLTPVSAGEVVPTTVELGSTSLILAAEHRLRVTLTSSSFPRYRVNRNNGDVLSATSGPGSVVEVTFHHSNQYPSYVELPLIGPLPDDVSPCAAP
jgi:hypothetical protein